MNKTVSTMIPEPFRQRLIDAAGVRPLKVVGSQQRADRLDSIVSEIKYKHPHLFWTPAEALALEAKWYAERAHREAARNTLN